MTNASPENDSLIDFAPGLLALIEKPSRRDDVVPLYATAILFECFARPPQSTTRWPVVNDAIITRWSLSALVYIKKRAWQRAKENARERVAAQQAVGEATNDGACREQSEPRKPNA